MDEEVMRKHIELYVNDYSVQLGPEGRKAVQMFYAVYARINGIHPSEKDLFLL
jgi:1,4-dihydroxy-6-naphthoate synthase